MSRPEKSLYKGVLYGNIFKGKTISTITIIRSDAEQLRILSAWPLLLYLMNTVLRPGSHLTYRVAGLRIELWDILKNQYG